MKPRFLRDGDKVAILSPASVIDPMLVAGAADTLMQLGYEPVVMPHALGTHGSYSGTKAERLSDLTAALTDTSVRAILCSRGGYGSVHLIEDLVPVLHSTIHDPKWLIGFSDISALHALWNANGIESIHGSMARQLALGPDTEATCRLIAMLTGQSRPLEWENKSSVSNRQGIVTARLTGGNLAVLDSLIGTPYNALKPGNILFIEDIAEPIYKIERMLYHMKLSGILEGIAGLIVGRFTEYSPDRNHSDMESMIARLVEGYGFPVAFDAPVGHIGGDNMPLPHGSTVTLEVTANHCVLQ